MTVETLLENGTSISIAYQIGFVQEEQIYSHLRRNKRQFQEIDSTEEIAQDSNTKAEEATGCHL